MSKFDIVGFLAENKLTESGRKERVHFGETKLNRAGMKLLSEMQMKADPDAESLPMEESDFGGDVTLESWKEYFVDSGWDDETIEKAYYILQNNQPLFRDIADGNADIDLDDVVAHPDEYADIDSDTASATAFKSKHYGQMNEAGYTDDDDDDYGVDDEFDFSAGDSMVNRLAGGDKRAKKAFDKTNDVNLDEPETPEFPDSADDEFEEPEQMSDEPNANAQPGLSSQLKYDPQQVEFDMNDDELNDFLNGFRRPQVAVKVLQRALDQAKAEMEDSPAMKKFYLVLDNGFYKTSAFRKGNVIATIRRKA